MKTLSATSLWLGLGVFFAVGVNSVFASLATTSDLDENNKRFRLRESRQELFDQEEGYDDYDYYLYLPETPSYKCLKDHGVGERCTAAESWWLYHRRGSSTGP